MQPPLANGSGFRFESCVQAGQASLGTHPNWTGGIYTSLFRSGQWPNLVASNTDTYLNSPSSLGNVWVRARGDTMARFDGTADLVSFPANVDVAVYGTLQVGLIREAQNYNLNSTGICHSHGNLTCYWGSTTVNCPAGWSVVGGGVNATSGRYGHISRSYPNTDSSWTCESSYDLVGTTDTCYAICARLD